MGAHSTVSAEQLSDSVVASAVLDAVPCLVAVIDLASDLVVHVNSTLASGLGRPADELRGTCWEALFEDDDRATVRGAITGSCGSALGVETSLVTRQGDRRRVLWSVAFAAFDPGDPAARHVVLTGIDVTPEPRTAGLFSQLMRTAAAPALLGTDLEGRITLYNAAAERMLGYPASAMIGRVLDQAIFDPSEFEERAQRLGVPADLRMLTGDLSKLDRRRSNLDLGSLDRRRRGNDQAGSGDRRGARQGSAADRRSGRGSQARDWTLVRHGGERFTASLVVVQVTDASGEPIGYLGVAEDVTEQRRSRSLLVAGLEREAEAVRRLKELDRAKDDFVATVSHELRTPITSILGYVELLLDTHPDDIGLVHRDMLETVRRNGDRLRILADDLLTLSSFESDEFSLHVTQVDLGDLVRRVEEALRPLIADRRLDTTFEVPPHPVVISGDAAHLERVLFNLLSNALKFTEDGGTIGCVLRSEAERVVLEVSDTGIGIPAEEQEQLFTRFFRSSTAQERAIQGTGMGLAIVFSIVHRHGGDVRVVSEDRHGTTVSVELPLSSVLSRAV